MLATMSYITKMVCILSIVVLLSVSAFKALRRLPAIESFSPQAKTKNTLFCEYKADTGYTCPLVVSDGKFTVQPFSESGEKAMIAASQALKKEWGNQYSIEYISKMWEGTDVLYIMTNRDGSFVGCVAVDRKQFVPVLSHLYVDSRVRNNGHAKKLLQVIDEYVKVLGFNEIKLWCDPKLRRFYESVGWQLESEKTENGKKVLVMNKFL